MGKFPPHFLHSSMFCFVFFASPNSHDKHSSLQQGLVWVPTMKSILINLQQCWSTLFIIMQLVHVVTQKPTASPSMWVITTNYIMVNTVCILLLQVYQNWLVSLKSTSDNTTTTTNLFSNYPKNLMTFESLLCNNTSALLPPFVIENSLWIWSR